MADKPDKPQSSGAVPGDAQPGKKSPGGDKPAAGAAPGDAQSAGKAAEAGVVGSTSGAAASSSGGTASGETPPAQQTGPLSGGVADPGQKAPPPTGGAAPPPGGAPPIDAPPAPSASTGGTGNDEQDFLTQLQEAMGQLQQGQSAALGELRDLRAVTQALLSNEADRLSSRLGQDHPRVVATRALIEENQVMVQGLDSILEIASIQVPPVQTDGALVNGRVVDGDGRGIAGLRVQVEDASGAPLAFLGVATTDASGYFALAIGPDALKKYQAVKGGGTLTVRSTRGVILEREAQPLALSANAQVNVSVALDRLNPLKANVPPTAGTAPPKKEG